MMNNELELNEDLTELKDTISECADCVMVATLKKFIKSIDGDYNAVDLNQIACDVINDIYIRDGLMYVTITPKDSNSNALIDVRKYFQTVLKRCTDQNLNREEEDYALVIDFVKTHLEKNFVYTLSFFQPLYMFFEDTNILTIISQADSINYGKEILTQAEIDYEESQYSDDFQPSDNDFHDNDDILKNIF